MINLLEKLPFIFYNTFFAFFTFVALLSCMYILYLIFALLKKKIVVDSRYHLLFLYYAASVALFSAIGSLIYSEVVGFIPCTYCWYQRGVMYPLVILLIFMVVKKISNMPALALSGVGVLISIRHIYFQTGGGGSGACSIGIPCSLKYVEIFNFISIPSMAFTAFLTIFLSLLYYELLQKVKDE